MEDQTPQHESSNTETVQQNVSSGIAPTTPIIPAIDSEVEQNVEEKQIEEIQKQYRLTPKFNAWCELFFNKGNKETYLNKTESAVQAYSLDPVKQRVVAASMGYQNFRKLQSVASQIADDKGYNFEKWLDVGWLNALRSQSPEWWDRMGDVLGFKDLKPTVINNTQNNTQININEADQVSFNDQFKKFVETS